MIMTLIDQYCFGTAPDDAQLHAVILCCRIVSGSEYNCDIIVVVSRSGGGLSAKVRRTS